MYVRVGLTSRSYMYMYLGRQKCPSLKNNCFSHKAGRKGKDPKYDHTKELSAFQWPHQRVLNQERESILVSPSGGNTVSMKCEKCDMLKYINYTWHMEAKSGIRIRKVHTQAAGSDQQVCLTAWQLGGFLPLSDVLVDVAPSQCCLN